MLTPKQLIDLIINEPMGKVGADVDYIVKNINGIITIAFKGSNSKTDLLVNLLCFKQPYNVNGTTYKIHSGFLTAWVSAKERIKADMQKAEKQGVKGYQITGHSLGAALALLCFLDLGKDFKSDNVDLTVFGCPRVFGWENKKILNTIFKNAKLIRNGSDIVTHIPPLFLGFIHSAKIVKIGKPTYKIKEHYSESYKASLNTTKQYQQGIY